MYPDRTHANLTATYSGDTNHAGSTSPAHSHEVTRAATATALTASPDPSEYGETVTLTATVSPSSATGAVTFYDDATELGVGTLSAGTATLADSTLSVGTHANLTATYSGDTNYEGSSSPAHSHEVTRTATATALTSSPNPSEYGETVMLTATVSPSFATGTVTFYEGETELGTGALSAGTATMADSTLSVGTHPNLTAVYGGDANCEGSVSPAHSHEVTRAETATALTSSPNPSTYGAVVTLTATVSPPAATGTVTFYDDAVELGTGTLSAGTATLNDSTLSVGTHANLTALYGGDANYAGSASAAHSHEVTRAGTATALTSSPNPSEYGEVVTLTATVTPSSATGTVTFYDDGAELGTGTLSAGTATLADSTLTGGTHANLTAIYSGDTNYVASTSPAHSHEVTRAATATALTSAPNPSTYGEAVTLTATVTPSTATGTVTFYDDGAELGVGTLSAGIAMLSDSTLSVGTHANLTAAYEGDTNYAGSTSSAHSHEVTRAATETALTSSPNPSEYGESVTLTATVSPAAATGTVTFYDDGAELGTGTLSGGVAALAVSTLSVGTHANLTAAYEGDTNYEGSSSPAHSHEVTRATTATALVSSPNPSTYGEIVTLTATVSPPVATGTVTFYDDGTELGTGTLSAGTATLADSTLSVGTHANLTAVYGGDTNYAGSASPAHSHEVTRAATATALTSTPNPSVYGEAVTLTATVSPSAATGTVTFHDDGVELGAGTLSAGTATLIDSTFAGGTHANLTAVYAGDANYAGSISPAHSHEVTRAETATALTSSPNPSVYGEIVTLTATVNPATATGTVTFYDDAVELGTGTLLAGTATLSDSTLAGGTHANLTATYGGDDNYAGSTSPAHSHEVTRAATATALTSSPNPSEYGESVTLTATVSPSAATGTVTFYDDATELGTASLSAGIATLAVSTLAVGAHANLTAAYSGDTNYAESTSPAHSHEVIQAETATALTSSPNPSEYSEPVTLTATVTPSTATGTVTFYDDGAELDTGTLSSGVATLAISTLSLGTHANMTAAYGGDANHLGSTSAAHSHEVIPLTYELDITIVGPGSVTRDPDLPVYDPGTIVTLTAIPEEGWPFTGWSGDVVSTDNPLLLTMDGDKALTATFGNVVRSVRTGNWNATSTWSSGAIPTASDHVVICNGHTVTINFMGTCYSLTVGEGTSGTLIYETVNTRWLTVETDVTIAAGATLTVGTASTSLTHKLMVGGDLTNNGTLNLTPHSGVRAMLVLTGESDAVFCGSGSTSLYNLTVDKGTSRTALLELRPNSLSIWESPTSSLLTLSNGTLRVCGSFALSSKLFASPSYSIPGSAGFWLDNPNVTVTAWTTSDPTDNYGLIRITQGTWNFGNSLIGQAGAAFVIEGGTLNVALCLADAASPVSYVQSGGTVNVTVSTGDGTNGGFDLRSSSSLFDMSGGTIILNRWNTSTIPAYRVSAETAIVAGGTLQVGSDATGASNFFPLAGILPNVVVDSTGYAKTAAAFDSPVPHSALDVTINAGSTLNLSGRMWEAAGGTFTNNGTINGTTTGSTLAFVGSSPQLYTGSGTVTPPLDILTVNNPAGVTLDAGLASNVVALRVNLVRGTLMNAGRLTLGNGAGTSPITQIGEAGLEAPGGAYDTYPVLNPGASGYGVVYAQEGADHTTGFELPESRSLGSITINNPLGVTLAGGGLEVTKSLTLTSGLLNTDAENLLTLTIDRYEGDVPGSASSYVSGPLAREFYDYQGSWFWTFPVGRDGAYRPVVLTDVSLAGGLQTFTVEVVPGSPGGTPEPPLLTLDPARYWRIGGTANLNPQARVNLTFGPDDAIDFVAAARVAQSASAEGSYTNLGGTTTGGAGGGTVESTVDLTPGNDYFSVGLVSLAVTWDGGAGTSSWGDSLNWSTDEVPTTSSNVTLSAAAPSTIELDASYACGGLVIAPNAALHLGTHSLTVNGPFDLGGGSIALDSGTLELKGSFIRSGGTFDGGTGTTIFSGSSTQSIGGGVTHHNLVMRDCGPNQYKSLTAGTHTVANDFTVESTASLSTTGTVTLTVGGNLYYGGINQSTSLVTLTVRLTGTDKVITGWPPTAKAPASTAGPAPDSCTTVTLDWRTPQSPPANVESEEPAVLENTYERRHADVEQALATADPGSRLVVHLDDMTVVRNPQPPDGQRVPPSEFWMKVTVASGASYALTDDISLGMSVTLLTVGGRLNCGLHTVGGVGRVTLESTGALGTEAPDSGLYGTLINSGVNTFNSGSIVDYNADGDQSIYAPAHPSGSMIYTGGSGTKTLSANLSISGSSGGALTKGALFVGGGTTFADGGRTLTLNGDYGNVIVNGTFSSSGAGCITFTGAADYSHILAADGTAFGDLRLEFDSQPNFVYVDATGTAELSFRNVTFARFYGGTLKVNNSGITHVTITGNVTFSLGETTIPLFGFDGTTGTDGLVTVLGNISSTNLSAVQPIMGVTGNNVLVMGGSAPQSLTLPRSAAILHVTSTPSTTGSTLRITNPAGLTLGGGGLMYSVLGTVALEGGNVITGGNVLDINRYHGARGQLTRTSGHVVGDLRKWRSADSSPEFEIGSGERYTPVQLSFSGATGDGTFTASTTGADHPQIDTSGLDPDRTVNRSYRISTSGITFTSCNATFNFVGADVDSGADPSLFLIKRYYGSTWHATTVGTRTATSTQATGLTAFGDFAIGQTPWTITATAGPNGSISPSGAVLVSHGDDQTFTMTPDPGYQVATLTVDGGQVQPTTSYTFTDVMADHTVDAQFSMAAGYTWIGGASGDWTVGTNWMPARSWPAPNDRLHIDADGAIAVSNVPTQTVGSLSVASATGGSVVLQPGASGNVLTIADTSGVSFSIANACTLVASAGMQVVLASDATAGVEGALSIEDSFTSLGTLSVNGALEIGPGGLLVGNPPTYSDSAALDYASGGTYGRGIEWSATSGPGYPANVRVSNATTLDLGNGDPGTARQMAGDLSIDLSSALAMDHEANDMTAALTVLGSLHLNGTLSLSDLEGGDLHLAGDWDQTGIFYPQSRAVFFSGDAPQTITGPAVFDRAVLNNAAGLMLSSDMTVNQMLTFTSGNITTGAWKVVVPSGGAILRTSGHVAGNLQMGIETGSDVGQTFVIGDSLDYTPVFAAFGNVTTAGHLKASTVRGDHPEIGSSALQGARSVNRYWSFANEGVEFDVCDVTMNFVPADVDTSANPASFVIGKYDGSWSYPTVGTRTEMSTQATGLTSFSDLAIAESNTHTIMATVTGGNGTIDPPGAVSVVHGFDQTFTMVANPGYHVGTLTVDGSPVEPATTYTFEDVVTDHTIDVVYAENSGAVGDVAAAPKVTELLPCAPNPFSPATTLTFRLAHRADVRLTIFSIDGRLIRTLVAMMREPGEYRVNWDGRDNQGAPVSAGTYLARLRAGGVVQTRSIMLLK